MLFVLINNLSSQPANNAETKPSKYMAIKIRPCKLKNPKTNLLGTTKEINKVYTGKRAEQLINGVTKIVIKRSFQFSILRADIIAGTAQAIPEINGTTDLPLRPKFFIKRSIIKVTRAM